MNKTNYALITALYDTKGADLYNDVYFPIIKYEIVNKYHSQVDVEKYYDLEELQKSIDVDFGIVIPQIVLKQSIRCLYNNPNGISLSIYENGKYFKIKKAWDIDINLSIDNKSKDIEAAFVQLEDLYKQFLDTEGLAYEFSFVQFYTDNTEDILLYSEGLNSNVIIDEKYTNLAKFLCWIKKRNVELYNIANDIFWASIIAGFLKRNTADINIKSLNRVEYFLDSSLVLAALDLDNNDNVKYAREMLDIIISSGNIPKVHSLTIREIKYILNSVEKEQGPRPNSAIEEAYFRRNLSPSKILRIKNNLEKLISEIGIVIQSSSKSELDDIEHQYKNKKSVKDLEKFRGNSVINGIRDIHDVYVKDYIQKKRKDIVSIEKINAYFVTLNNDLISYFNLQAKQIPLLIHPSKIIVDLWIHSSHSSFVKKYGLTEIMSRCFALNQTDIRRKIRLVAKYYKESDSDYSEDNYKAVYEALINRSTKAINEVNSIIENEKEIDEEQERNNKEHIEALIRIALQEQLQKQEINSELSRKNIELEQSNQEIQKTLKEEKNIYEANQQLSAKQHEKDTLLIEKLRNNVGEISRINKIIEAKNVRLNQLGKEREKSVCMMKYYIILVVELLVICVLFMSILLIVYDSFSGKEITDFRSFFKNNWKSIIPLVLSVIALFIRDIKSLYILSPKIKYKDIKKEQLDSWDDSHHEYNKLKQEISELSHRIEELQKDIE